MTSLGVGQRFAEGIARQVTGLIVNDFQGERIMWADYPSGCPTHQEVPYGFKPAIIDMARQDGLEQVLWMDAACVPVKSLDGLFDRLGRLGVLLQYSPNSVWEWCSDACAIEMGVEGERVRQMGRSCWACVMGFDFRTGKAHEFLDRWLHHSRDGVTFHGAWTNEKGQVSSDPLVKGHRHDQTVASILAYEMGLPFSLGVVGYDLAHTMPVQPCITDAALHQPDFPAYVMAAHNVKTAEHSG